MRTAPPPEKRHRKGAVSPTTLRHVHAILHACLHQAVRWGVIPASPADRVDPPPVGKSRIQSPSAVSVAKAIEVAQARWGADAALLVRLAAATGCRRGELAALRWGDVDLVRGVVRVARAATDLPSWRGERAPKTASSVRQFSIDPDTQDALRARLERARGTAVLHGVEMLPDGFVLSAAGDSSQWWPPDRWSHSWARIRKAAGIPATVRLHDLRHFMATELLAAGVPLAVVSERLGHAKTSTTLDIYTHSSDEGDAHAARVMGALLPRRDEGPPPPKG